MGDIDIESRRLRLGSRVVVDGMQRENTRKLNGLHGRVAQHGRESHPAFLASANAPEKQMLTVLVRFDNALAAGSPSLFLEPRFLKAVDDVGWSRATTPSSPGSEVPAETGRPLAKSGSRSLLFDG